MVIRDAFQRLQRTVTEEDAHQFASTELNDVKAAVIEIQNVQRKRQSVQNLRRVDGLLRGIEKYSKVIEVLCNGTPYMPYVWVCISFHGLHTAMLTFEGTDKVDASGRAMATQAYLENDSDHMRSFRLLLIIAMFSSLF